MTDYSLLEGPQGATVLRRDGDRQVVVAGPGLNPDEARRVVDGMNRGDGISFGSLLEWVAGGALVSAGFWYADTRVALACVAGVIALFYLAQCYANSRLRLPRIRLPRRRSPRASGRRPTHKDRLNASLARLRHRAPVSSSGYHSPR